MKVIAIYSHTIKDSKLNKRKCLNGDEYDSQIEVWEEGKKLWIGICNVDSTNNMKHKVEIKNGNYWGIAGEHKGKYKAILLLNQKPKVQNWAVMTEKIRTLPTKEINKKWNDRIAKYINIHKGGDNWDWSEGCITIYKKDYDKFIGLFKINEIVNIEKI